MRARILESNPFKFNPIFFFEGSLHETYAREALSGFEQSPIKHLSGSISLGMSENTLYACFGTGLTGGAKFFDRGWPGHRKSEFQKQPISADK